MKNYLGDILFQARQEQGLTQDQFGAKYSVSGPAIFKFEKGYVKPSLELWLKMAMDADITERRAVLLWAKAKLPEQYQEYIELQGATEDTAKSKKGAPVNYSKIEERDQMRQAMDKDKTMPKGLRELLDDDELWALYKPTGHEINSLRDMFSPLGKGTKTAYREALRLIREFAHSF